MQSFFEPIEFLGLNKVNWVEKRLQSYEKMSKICQITLSADVSHNETKPWETFHCAWMQGEHCWGMPEQEPPKSGGKQDPKMAPETRFLVFSLTEHPPFGWQWWTQLELEGSSFGASIKLVSMGTLFSFEGWATNPFNSVGKETGGLIVSGWLGSPKQRPL